MKDRQNLDTKYVGTVFDRQVRIDLWNQDVVKQQVVLILGVGGLGSAVMINLLRLGVGKIFIVDYDVVDNHNLNRQLLYSVADVGVAKVEAALKNSNFHNVGNTQIQIFHGNALTNWTKIVDFAKQSDIIYNCIDWGDKFDMAVASLSIKLKIPLIMGGTFSTSMTIDYFPPAGKPCYICTQMFKSQPEFADKIRPEIIDTVEDLSWLPKNNNPIGRSSVIVCTICAELMVSHYTNYLFLSQQKHYKASRLIFYHNTFQIIKFDLQAEKNCPFCGEKQIENNNLDIQKVKDIQLKQNLQIDKPQKQQIKQKFE